MSGQVIYETKAIDQATRFLADDSTGLSAVLDALEQLAVDPRPDESFAFGSPDRRRLRVGRYRVLYDITGEVISINHIARTTTTD